MFGLGPWEIAMILVIALIVLGPSKLPELARSLGKGIREFRKAASDLRSSVEEEAYRSPARDKKPEGEPAQILPPSAPPAPVAASTEPPKLALGGAPDGAVKSGETPGKEG